MDSGKGKISKGRPLLNDYSMNASTKPQARPASELRTVRIEPTWKKPTAGDKKLGTSI